MNPFYLSIINEPERLISLSVTASKSNGYFKISYKDTNPLTKAIYVLEEFELQEHELSKLGNWINDNISK